MSDAGNELARLLASQYPTYDITKDNTAMEFSDEGSNYRVYFPTGHIYKDNSMDLTIQIDHILGGQPDDHATITVSFDANGQYKASPVVSYDMSGGVQIPDWAFYTVDGVTAIGGLVVGAVVGVVAAAVTSPTGPGAVAIGVGAGVVTDVVVTAIGFGITGAMDLFNHLSNVVKDSSDDGGGVYLAEVISHTLIRTSTAVLMYQGQTFEQSIGFDYDDFLDEIDQSSWDDKSGAAVKYQYDGDHFRTWKPDYSVNYQNMGLFVSSKIDGIRDNNTDDHVIVGCVFDYRGGLVSAQVCIRMENEDNLDIGTVMYQDGNLVQATSTGVVTLTGYDGIADAVHDLIDNHLKTYSHYDDFPNERKNLPHITKMNINAIANSIDGHG